MSVEEKVRRAIAVVGVGAILPDAPNAAAFWQNVKQARYSIGDVPRERWDPALYYDPDPKAPEKTYSKIGGWVREWDWNPLKWGLPIPPRVMDGMDDGQKWAVACAREALADCGHPQRPLDLERTAVILGNAMAGEKHYLTALRIYFPEYAAELEAAPSFAALPPEVRAAVTAELHTGVGGRFPQITEDTMPGELSNCIAGRIANLFNVHGPNFVVDAACASAMAAISAAVNGLVEGEYDAAITGGIDRNMGASAYVKFSKIGALSATGTRPYADGADGFVMGEGAAVFVLKRLRDAERAGDRIYAVIRGVGGSSDGKGKGITAPNPIGQRLALERAWRNAGLSPATASLVEGHGTSTRVGDVVEVESLTGIIAGAGARSGTIALGSVKSNIGHLKAAAGAAGLLKTVLALHESVLPPSLNFTRPNPSIDFAHSPLRVNTALRDWERQNDEVRRAGVSAFGFGGTNFHLVLEEHVPGLLTSARSVAVPADLVPPTPSVEAKAPPRGALVVGAPSHEALAERLRHVREGALAGSAPRPAAPAECDLRAPERIAIDFGDAAELAEKAARALKALDADNPAMWKALRAQGVFRGRGPAPKLAFLYTGQGSQYANMLDRLRAVEPIVADTFRQADRVMTPLLGEPLSSYLFVDAHDAVAVAQAEDRLKQTAITQPAVLAVDAALTRLLAAYGIAPDMVMGHSLGEYGALVAAGALSFEDALEAVSARGREMTTLSVEDNGRMAAVFAPLAEVERILATIDGNVVIANVNSNSQSVIGGATRAVEQAVEAFVQAGFNAIPLPVSHAFHTSIVAPASAPLRRTLERLGLRPPAVPVVANVNGEFYPQGAGVEPQMLDILARQVASPVQFVRGLRTLYDAGARVFVEVGPKKALQGFVDDVLGDRPEIASLFTNHPKIDDVTAFNQALCGLYAAGFGVGSGEETRRTAARPAPDSAVVVSTPGPAPLPSPPSPAAPLGGEQYTQLGRLFAEFIDRARALYPGGSPTAPETVVVSGAALGLPGVERVFDDANVGRILDGRQLIDVIPSRLRHAILDKHITRLVKSDEGGARFESIDSVADVIKLAARAGHLDLAADFGIAEERLAAFDVVTRLAIGAGIDALRDAGLPLVMRYRTTSKNTRLPERWMLPDALRDDTGIIFASAFPGYDAFASDMARYHADRSRRDQVATLTHVRARLSETPGHEVAIAEIDHLLHELETAIAADPYVFDRRFLFRVLAMGHSQFAELIGARGPNTHINAACASTTQGVALAEDWIRAGRCRRVVIVAGDDVTSENLLEWMGAGFLVTGAAATDEVVEDAALPFDRRRHGMLLGMGAAAIVIEGEGAARERGLRPICEVLGAVTANSAFHGTRLDVDHICQVMETLVSQAERRHGVRRQDIAARLVFVSHETYTPARGGSAAAEVHALRKVFGAATDQILIANTKGYTGHPMGVGIEDVVAIKALETGLVPAVPNFRDVDPDLGPLHLSQGGAYPVEFALRLGAGFGSQISMTLMRWVASPGPRPNPDALGYQTRIDDFAAWNAWLARISGEASPDLEVGQRTLRIRDRGPAHLGRTPAAPPAPPTPAPLSTPPPAPAPAQTAPANATPPPPAAGPSARGDEVSESVLALVAEKTGYPRDMLDLELDLEADLGIDTVKQAEVFASVRQAYDIPRDDKLKLRDFPTLAHVIQFVRDRRPDLAAAAPPAPSPEAVATAPPAPAAAGCGGDEVTESVLALVAEKTGYPRDMLDLELDLEADLGIDTVKQAEVFASVRQAFDIPRDDKLKLRDFPTLAHVIQFVRDRRPSAPGGPAEGVPVTTPAAASASSVEAAGRVPRRVPVAVLRPPLSHCQPTGVRLAKGARVIVMPDEGGVAKALIKRLKKAGAEALLLDFGDAEALTARIRAWLNGGPVSGVFWLPALDVEPELGNMGLVDWREALRRRVKLLYAAMRALYEQVAAPGSFLLSATRLGGRHGYDEAGASAPLGGAVTGFTKTYKRERPEALVKAVDFAPAETAAAIAEQLLEETLSDPGAVEVGRRDGLRWTVSLEEQPAEDGRPGLILGRESVFVVTGAAGGIVSAIVADLAAASGGTFHLLDKVLEPDPSNPDLRRFASDKENLKRDLFDRIKARGERATPALVERELAVLERAHAALGAIEAVQRAGGTAHYHSVDLTDGGAVAGAIDAVRRSAGRIDVLLHAAGLEISRLLPDKEPREYDLVFDVKSDGWFNLLSAIGDMPLAATVVFSSIAGRFGNGGQSDYSAANDLLCKISSSFRRTRPGTRAIAIDWTAWASIGMATRGSIPKMMELAGIDMLPPEVGVPVVRRELTAGGRSGELLIGRRLGVLARELDETGGLRPEAFEGTTRGPMLGRIVSMGVHEGLAVETRLDPSSQPFLHDHQIDGTPVLPGVMGVEAFAEMARLLLPGWHIAAVEDMHFLAPFKFYRGEPRVVFLGAVLRADGEDVLAHCRLTGRRMLAGQAEEQITTHFAGRVRLTRTAPAAETTLPVQPPNGAAIGAGEVYRIYFHGPAYQVLERVWRSGDLTIGLLRSPLPPNHVPAEAPTAVAPRLLEFCFQTAGMREIAARGRMALPQQVESFVPLAPDESAGPLYCVVSGAGDGCFDAQVVDAAGAVRVAMRGYRTVELPAGLDAAELRPLRDALA